ncbi:MAG: hypothetical protein OEY93_12920, partial [Anaerolineae bacterium]|nr:hypothetical protein [Anaerolineae bacterium]
MGELGDILAPTPISTATSTEAPLDSDGDGIPDALDACPNRGDEGNGIKESGCPAQPGENPVSMSMGEGLISDGAEVILAMRLPLRGT